MLKTFTWISFPSYYDVFQQLLGVSDYNVQGPLAIDDMLIHSYIRIPLYNGFVKNTITSYNISDNFERLTFNNNIVKLIFNINNIIETNEIQGVIDILKIILYKYFNYNIDTIHIEKTDTMIKLVPMTKILYLNTTYNEYVYCTNKIFNNINQTINIENIIGYRPLLTLCQDIYNIDIDVLSSDLIWTYDLSSFNYVNLLNIPIISMLDNINNEIKSVYIEFNTDKILPMISHILKLQINSFYLSNDYLPILHELIKVFNFTIINSKLTDKFCMKHDVFDKNWILNTIDNISNGKLPMYSIINSWYFDYESDINSMVFLKYATIRSIIDYIIDQGKDEYYILLDHLNDIIIHSDLSVYIPILSIDMIDFIKHNINNYLGKEKYVKMVSNENDAVFLKLKLSTLYSKASFLVFELHDNWYVVGNVEILNEDYIHYDKFNKYYIPYNPDFVNELIKRKHINFNIPINNRIIEYTGNDNITDKQLQYLWSSGKYLQDWAKFYYLKFNIVSIIPFKTTSSIMFNLTVNV